MTHKKKVVVMQDDVGTAFEWEVLDENGNPKDVSDQTTMEVRFRKPDKATVFDVTTTFVLPIDGGAGDGTDGLLQAITGGPGAELDVSGGWYLQGHVAGPGYDFRSEWGFFEVGSNL